VLRLFRVPAIEGVLLMFARVTRRREENCHEVARSGLQGSRRGKGPLPGHRALKVLERWGLPQLSSSNGGQTPESPMALEIQSSVEPLHSESDGRVLGFSLVSFPQTCSAVVRFG
jgi:hypothetical protein